MNNNREDNNAVSADIKSTAVNLSVVLPTYNEMHRLPQTMREVLPYLQQNFPDYELIIVDDNSPDGTAAWISEHYADNPRVKILVQSGRIGKGAAVRRGCLAAQGELVLFMDADHATPISELDAIVPYFKDPKVQVVTGVRTYQENESKSRRILGLTAQILAHIVVFQKAVVDSQCGFKIFRRDTVRRIFPLLQINGGMIDVELFFLLHKFNIPCRYQPVRWDNKDFSRINVLRCIMLDPLDMIKIRIRDLLGGYGARDQILESNEPKSAKNPA